MSIREPELISLKRIDIKAEDLNQTQVLYAKEYNEMIKEIDSVWQKSISSDSHFDIAKYLQIMSVYRQRIGAIIPNLRYESKKVDSTVESIYRNAWKTYHLQGLNATSCNKLAEIDAYTPENEKHIRISEWLLELFEGTFESIQGIIHSTNRAHDDLSIEYQKNFGRFQT